jgi:hypothetical protein
MDVEGARIEGKPREIAPPARMGQAGEEANHHEDTKGTKNAMCRVAAFYVPS